MRIPGGATRTTLMVIATTAALLLSACSSASPGVEPTPSPTAVATALVATPTPTPTHTSVPSIDLSDTGSWVITTSAIGPIALGTDQSLKLESLSSAFTQQEPPYENCSSAFFVSSSDSGLSLVVSERNFSADSPDDGSTQFIELRSDPGPVLLPSPKTREGVGVGSTDSDVRTTYPGIEQTIMFNEVVTYERQGAEGNYMIFAIDQEVVRSIAISTGENLPKEFC